MKLDDAGYKAIMKSEAFKAKPYLDTGGIPTIGYGNTYYPNGRKVTMSDPPLSPSQAYDLFKIVADNFTSIIAPKIKNIELSQSQFNALISFGYNLGPYGLLKSTLFKKVLYDPDHPSIASEFLKYVYGKVRGKKQKLQGLVNRRKDEIAVYFDGSKKKIEQSSLNDSPIANNSYDWFRVGSQLFFKKNA